MTRPPSRARCMEWRQRSARADGRSGSKGPGYFDANGQWRSYGTTINSTDPNTAGFQPDSNYNPDQATGWNARPTNMAEPPVDPGPAFRTNTVHAGGPVATRPITTPNSSTGAPAVQSPSASTYQSPATQTRPGLLTPNSQHRGVKISDPDDPNPMIMPGGLSVGGALALALAHSAPPRVHRRDK